MCAHACVFVNVLPQLARTPRCVVTATCALTAPVSNPETQVSDSFRQFHRFTVGSFLFIFLGVFWDSVGSLCVYIFGSLRVCSRQSTDVVVSCHRIVCCVPSIAISCLSWVNSRTSHRLLSPSLVALRRVCLSPCCVCVCVCVSRARRLLPLLPGLQQQLVQRHSPRVHMYVQ